MKIDNIDPLTTWTIRSFADLRRWQEQHPNSESFAAVPAFPFVIQCNPLDEPGKPKNFIVEHLSELRKMVQALEAPPEDSNYVLGFMFDKTSDTGARPRVLMLHKNKPKQQRGMLNGVGGHRKYGELPHAAMVREFHEETGIETCREAWTHYLTVGQPGVWKMDVFCAEEDLDVLYKAEDSFKSTEPLNCSDVLYLLSNVSKHQLVEHVPWMMVRALEVLRTRSDSVQYIQATQIEPPV